MKANELRIGNYFNGDVAEEITIVKATAKDILDFSDDPLDDYYKPIPLTEEWLERFGFKKPFDYWEFHKGKIFFDIAIKDGKYYYIFDCNYRVGQYINSVHCLQNLFFALTGEELEIKEEL